LFLAANLAVTSFYAASVVTRLWKTEPTATVAGRPSEHLGCGSYFSKAVFVDKSSRLELSDAVTASYHDAVSEV